MNNERKNCTKKLFRFYFFGECFLIILSTLLLGIAFFGASSFYFSKFEWSPFGCETCGLESIVWIIIYPIYLFSIISKYILMCKFNYKKWWFYLSFIMILIVSIPVKSLLLGVMALLFIVVEVILILYCVCQKEIERNQKTS